MRVQANSVPPGAFFVEDHPQREGYAQVRFIENIRETDADAGFEYDEYTVTVRKHPDLAKEIEGNYEAWLKSAKAADAAYSAAQQAEEAVKPIMEAAYRVAPLLDDKTASTAAELYPTIQYDGSLIANGTRINWNGELKRAAVDLWATKENNPDNAPALWEDINYKSGARVIPDEITTGLAFAEDELGWWHVDEQVYRSRVNANVYTPEQYAANWELVTENAEANGDA